MYLVFYPASNETYERHSFDCYDTSKTDEAKQVFEALYKEFHKDDLFHYYNLATDKRSSRHLNVADLVEDINDDELNSNTLWSIYLNLNEGEVQSIIDNVLTQESNKHNNCEEYVIIGFDGLPYCYPNSDEIIYYESKEDCQDALDDDDLGFIQINAEKCYHMEQYMAVVKTGDTGKALGSYYYNPENFDDELRAFCEGIEEVWHKS